MLLRSQLRFPFSCLKPKSHRKKELYLAREPSLTFQLFTRRRCFLNFDRKIMGNSVKFEGPIMDIKELEKIEDDDLVVETCIVRTLPPALTLEDGLQSINEAVEQLKLNPPSSSGMLRFQVAVPPSAKALNCFCSQPVSSAVFPLFFLSKERNNPTYKSLFLNRTGGVFGIGAAVYFTDSSSCFPGSESLINRYLSSDSIFASIYGFVDINFDTKSSSVKHDAGSFYFFIPVIELDEHDDVSILAATLAWSDSCLCSFEDAILSYELAFCQVRSHFLPTTERFHSKHVRSAIRKLNMVEDKTVEMVSVKALSLGRSNFGADPMELREAPSFCQFSFKFSPTVGVASNMLDHASEMTSALQDHVNINSLWASLVVEECSRLGLMYFCIAPGSRSSPLAVAASHHPLTTCIACFDERSLAFHAVGYAKGSHKPAVIITSSGTAVSNLLPAVVEASQDFVPLLLLTADRPPELQDAGANQSINQVNHFGSFVRYFFSLPPPTDHIPARMILTTLDSAVHWAMSSPTGPVHINCPFREPLDGSPEKWTFNCLKGLDIWMSTAEPFTQYMRVQHSHACFSNIYGSGQITELIEIIQAVHKGLLLIGAINMEDDIWAALLLAKHLQWPVVADILSGLRLRKIFYTCPEIVENILFVDYLDHALLSDSVRRSLQCDVIIQIGSPITSKRISQFLEECFPCKYILVENHPCRHDPLHLVTHRIQSSIMEFVSHLLKVHVPHRINKWCGYLQGLNKMVAQEISFQICTEHSLSEPHVMHVISKALLPESALFVGNSMVIRDADMYGCNWANDQDLTDTVLNSELCFNWIRVAGNRGASGIDGLLSTAIGFAVGCNKRVFCLIGDVSFLHDTNGLAILNQRMLRKPITILVINNHGGAIFSLLPIADRTEPGVLNQYFYTSHNISISKLCLAHGVKHLQVQTKSELSDALFTSQHEGTDCVIEIESSISANATFHRYLRKFSCQAADHAFGILSRIPASNWCFPRKIHGMEYSLYRLQLRAPPTSSSVDHGHSRFYREGFILSLTLEDGSVGYGEVAPLENRQENFQDVEEQIRFLFHATKGAKISYSLPLLKGSLSSWIWSHLGILACSLFPSVRCGLEMAILNAFAVSQDSNLLNILHHQTENEGEIHKSSSSVRICALLDCSGTPTEVAHVASTLVEEGYTAIKLKVARRADPVEDAAVIQEVRKKVGHQIELRVDANRNWTYEKAILFGSLVKNADLQYIEEPVQDEDDILRFCEESGLPVALDESIEHCQENPLNTLFKYSHPRIVALVIKPTVIGGFERAALIARWAQMHGKMAVISSAFESGLSLSSYILFSYHLELQNAEICKVMDRKSAPSIAHGLGTYSWLEEDLTTSPLGICQNPSTGYVEASVAKANRLLQKFRINQSIVHRTFKGQEVLKYQLKVDSNDFSCIINALETGQRTDDSIVFLHGFLGTGEDWIPIMNAISGSARCVSIDLPGHGGTKVQNHCREGAGLDPTLSMEIVADLLFKFVQHITPGKVTLVGYSMGARIALYMALKFSDKIQGAILVSGSPGLEDIVARKIRRATDDSRARSLVAHGLQFFIETWYAGGLWKSLRSHPNFNQIVAKRLVHGDLHSLAKVLSDLSIGRQQPLWEDLKQSKTPLMLIVGERDAKFKAIAQRMCREIENDQINREDPSYKHCELVEVPHCGHAVHLENPLPVIRSVRQFMTRYVNVL
ncbi:hypothetical protein SLE2022_219810 [Rubroshorea leprosula]